MNACLAIGHEREPQHSSAEAKQKNKKKLGL